MENIVGYSVKFWHYWQLNYLKLISIVKIGRVIKGAPKWNWCESLFLECWVVKCKELLESSKDLTDTETLLYSKWASLNQDTCCKWYIGFYCCLMLLFATWRCVCFSVGVCVCLHLCLLCRLIFVYVTNNQQEHVIFWHSISCRTKFRRTKLTTFWAWCRNFV